MTRLFLRFYLAMGAVVLLLGLVFLIWVQPQEELPERLQSVAEAPAVVAKRLTEAKDPKAREAAAQALSDYFAAPVTVEPLARIQASLGSLERERLQRGEPVVSQSPAGVALYVRVPDQPFVAVLQPQPPGLWRTSMLLPALILGLGLSVFATLWPLQRQLVSLSAAARRLGAGELEARAVVSTEDEAGRLAHTFNSMADQVARLIKAREELLLAVSHELRTPVARVRFAVELLADAEEPADRLQQAEAIQQDLQELDELISELLTYASLEGGRQPQRETLHFDHFLGARVEEAARIRASVTIDLIAFPLEIQADALLLKRALSNLLANAVRYGRSHIRVGMEQRPGAVQIWVEDDGPGIPEEDRERVFERLVRLDQTRSRDTGGVGLGLALARRIARAHGGELVAEQGSLGGARLRMTLPL